MLKILSFVGHILFLQIKQLRATSQLNMCVCVCGCAPLCSPHFFNLVPLHFDFLQIRDFHIAEREEDIGYYAGYVGEHIFYA